MAEEKIKTPKHRSPNYPFIGLEDAIMRLRQLYDTGRGHYVSIGTARDTWQYKRNAGDRTAAALKAYGLIEVQGEGQKRELKPTEDGIKILEDHSQKVDLLKTAALCPDIHKDVWDKYDGHLPSNEVMREYLRWTKKFNPDNVDKFIDQFLSTIAFANLSESDKITVKDSEDADQKLVNSQNAGEGGRPDKKPPIVKDGVMYSINIDILEDGRINVESAGNVNSKTFMLLKEVFEIKERHEVVPKKSEESITDTSTDD